MDRQYATRTSSLRRRKRMQLSSFAKLVSLAHGAEMLGGGRNDLLMPHFCSSAAILSQAEA